MAHATTYETDAQRIARIKATKPDWSAGRILSALGHPGYGDTFAKAVIARIEAGKSGDAFAAKSHVYNEMGIR